MKISKFKKSKYLTKADVEDMTPEQRQVVIEKVVEEEVGDEKEPKAVLYFKDLEKGYAANMTALETLEDLTGSDDTDDYAGVAVELYVDPTVRFAGKRIGGIRIKKGAKPEDLTPFDDDLDAIAQ